MKRFHCIVWKENKWFVAKALEIEVASQGKSPGEAVDNLKEALELYFEDQPKVELTKIERPRLEDFSIPIHA